MFECTNVIGHCLLSKKAKYTFSLKFFILNTALEERTDAPGRPIKTEVLNLLLNAPAEMTTRCDAIAMNHKDCRKKIGEGEKARSTTIEKNIRIELPNGRFWRPHCRVESGGRHCIGEKLLEFFEQSTEYDGSKVFKMAACHHDSLAR